MLLLISSRASCTEWKKTGCPKKNSCSSQSAGSRQQQGNCLLLLSRYTGKIVNETNEQLQKCIYWCFLWPSVLFSKLPKQETCQGKPTIGFCAPNQFADERGATLLTSRLTWMHPAHSQQRQIRLLDYVQLQTHTHHRHYRKSIRVSDICLHAFVCLKLSVSSV